MTQPDSSERSGAAWLWPVLVLTIALIPVGRAFSLTNVFHVRDLTMFFWPRHLWIRRVLLSGHWPLWDPYAAAGQAAFPDALNQLFLPPVVLLRLLFPAVLGFNLIVALPFPIAALGTWLLLRRHVSSSSAALGAMAFALSGPVVSTGSMPNLSWSVAWLPWLLWSVDRDLSEPSRRNLAVVGAVAAFQMLSGEPLTMGGSIVLTLAYSATVPSRSGRMKALGRTVAALVLAFAIASIQLVPMAVAARSSARGLMRPDDLWSLHPLWLVESLLPFVFGNGYSTYAPLPWLEPLNSGREPLFHSIFLGSAVVVLGLAGLAAGRRRTWFWALVVTVGIGLSLGSHGFVYPVLQTLIPVTRLFRYPAKFFVFASFGVAMLAAEGVEVLRRQAARSTNQQTVRRMIDVVPWLAAVAALAVSTILILVVAVPFTGARLLFNLGTAVGLRDPIAGAEFLFRSIPSIAVRTIALLFAAAALVHVAARSGRHAATALSLLCGLAIVELLSIDVGINPVSPANRLGPPAWVAALDAHRSDRFYFGGKFRGSLQANDVDLPSVRLDVAETTNAEDHRSERNSVLALVPAAWGVRELISYDLPLLWPVDSALAATAFEQAPRAGRLLFLARGGVRYCLQGDRPRQGLEPITVIRQDVVTMGVYECVARPRRAYVVEHSTVVPQVTAQLQRLFDPSFDADSTVMLQAVPPEPAGASGTGGTPEALIVQDGDDEVTIEAMAGTNGGFLVLLDSFDRFWRADVDGRAAPLLRANALYRAVRLAPGRHRVRFSYRPTILYASAAASSLAVLILIGVFVSGIQAPRPSRST